MKEKSLSRVYRVLGLVLLSLFLTMSYSCSSKEDKKRKHLERARHYIEKNELAKAVIELKNVIQADPKDDEAYVELGETHLKLKQGSEAFQAFSSAASANPKNLKAQLKLGQIFLLGRKPDEARKKADLILEEHPQNVDALSLLSGVQVQEKDLDGAIKTLEKAISIDPKQFNAQLSLARLFLLKGDQEKAENAYSKAKSLDPKSNVTYMELSRLYGSKGQMDKAEAELKQMLDAAGSTYQNLSLLALFYESTSKWEQAEKTHLDSIKVAPKEDVMPLMNLGGYYARRRNYDKALEVMTRAADINKDNFDVQVSIAQLHLDFNRVKEGDAVVDKVLEKDKGHVEANYLKGRILLSKRDFPGALQRFDLVVKERPRSDMGHYFRALALIGKGEAKLAEPDLLKSLELNPRLLEPRLVLAETYLRDRNRDLARQQIETALKLAPRDLRTHILNGNLKLLQQDVKAAEEAFKKVVELNPDFAPGYVRLGLLYNLTNRPGEAEKSFKKAIEVDPEQTEALALLTGMYVNEKKYDQALKACEVYKEKTKDKPPAQAFAEYLEGNIHMARNDRAKALQLFEKAVETNPNILPAYESLARIHIMDKNLAQAKAQYETLLGKNPRYLAGYMTLGTIADQEGDRKKAESYYSKALEIDRDFAPAANNLAWNLIEGGGNIDVALGLAQKAKEKMPKSPAVMDTLGWVYYLKGSYLNAISEFHDALELDKDNPVINFHMGMASLKSNQPQKAKEYIENALRLDPKFKGAEEARAALEQIKKNG